MAKFRNPFRKETPKEGKLPPKVECACILYMYENGGRTVGDIRTTDILINGSAPKRPCTLRDLRRMCGEVLEDLQSINVIDRLQGMFNQHAHGPQVRVEKPAEATPKEEVKTDAKPTEVKDDAGSALPAKEPERPTA